MNGSLNVDCAYTVNTFLQASLVSEKPPADDWPSSGQITFNQYSARYREELDLVVKNINADITGGEKVCE